MNEALWLYAFTRLDSLLVLFLILSIVLAFVSMGCALAAYEDDPWHSTERKALAKKLRKVWPKTSAASVFFAILMALIPSKNDAIFIVAGTGVIEAAKSEHVQRVAGKAAAVVEKALDDYLGKKEK